MSIFYSNFMYLCMQKGESVNGAASKIGVSSGTVTNWKNGQVPSIRLLTKVADYFNVSPEEMATINLNVYESFTPAEIQMIKMFRALNIDGKKKALEALQDLTDIARYTEDTSLSDVG